MIALDERVSIHIYIYIGLFAFLFSVLFNNTVKCYIYTVLVTDKCMSMDHWWNDPTQEKWSTRRKICSSATLSTTNTTQTEVGWNLDHPGERLATNLFSRDTGRYRVITISKHAYHPSLKYDCVPHQYQKVQQVKLQRRNDTQIMKLKLTHVILPQILSGLLNLSRWNRQAVPQQP
jgi:hypothetical protein